VLENSDIRDTKTLPTDLEVLADLIYAPDQQVWRLQNLIGTHMVTCRQCRRDQLRRLLAILRGEHLGNSSSTKRAPAASRTGDFLLKGFGSGVHDILPLAIGASPGDKPDNVSLSGCDGEQVLASAANVKRRMRTLHRLEEPL
jgi:hypothetical protein